MRELHGSRIVVEPGLLDRVGDLLRNTDRLARARVAIITDETVGALYGPQLRAALGPLGAPAAAAMLTVPAGEASKTRKQWSRLTDELLEAGYGRDSIIIALGGGVVGDLAGFVAATFMRGVPVVQVPTTLLAMIDAAIGGKTGVDTRAGKNLVGAFHQATLVLADPVVLRTLPHEHLRSGLAEAVKHAVIASPSLLEAIESGAGELLQEGGPPTGVAEQLVSANIRIKADVVEQDEHEGGIRKILNFGHTIGHAIESASDYTLSHGECVAIGMVAESRLAVRLRLAAPEVASSIERVLRTLGLSVHRPESLSPEKLLAATRSDKKARAGQVEYVLPITIGRMAGEARGYGIPVADDLVHAVLAEL